MKIAFPSPEFDDVVASVCHGLASPEQATALNEVLRSDSTARDEYVLRLELHSRLASDADLFSSPLGVPTISSGDSGGVAFPHNVIPGETHSLRRSRVSTWALGLAASIAVLASGLFWRATQLGRQEHMAATSKAVAMLNGTVDARWSANDEPPRLSAPLEPGWLRLESGLIQVVFYSGARVVLQGPAEFQLVSRDKAFCRRGRLLADVPPQARGFRIETPQANITDLGTSFGLEVKDIQTELHVFKGCVDLQSGASRRDENMEEGAGAVIESSGVALRTAANPVAFSALFELREKFIAAEALRYNRWRATKERINSDPALVVHFDFESSVPKGWQLQNLAQNGTDGTDAVIVGCQRGEGRWPEKRALEFRSVSDRVRVTVPGEFEALTLSAWVCVKGLDRKINSLFMCDGFQAGTIHWLIRNDGVLGITVIGAPAGNYQIVTSQPALKLDKFGMWLHLAVVLDGSTRQVLQYLNGVLVSQQPLKIAPPYLIGAAELGNWNADGFVKDDPFMIRNFSGAMDEFCIYRRALNGEEIVSLYTEGKPQSDNLAAH